MVFSFLLLNLLSFVAQALLDEAKSMIGEMERVLVGERYRERLVELQMPLELMSAFLATDG
jgi:cob(I)alamin adenosyltransferase